MARAVSVRLSHLPADAGALARAIAVLGHSANLGVAAALAGLERPAAAAASAALARAELLRVEPALEFTHPVVRAAICEAIGRIDRSEAHRRAAELLTEARDDPGQVASHLLLVSPASDPFVTSTLRKAAKRAPEQGAPEAAIAYLRRALDEPPGDQSAAVMLELAGAEQLVGGPDAVEHFAKALALADNPEQSAVIALRYSRALWLSGRFGKSIEVVQRAIDGAEAIATPLREELDIDCAA